MSGTTPPGTQWLQNKRSRPKIQDAAAIVPLRGSWQWAVKDNGDGSFGIYGSDPSTDTWTHYGNHVGRDNLLGALNGELRQHGGLTPWANE